MAKNTTTGRQEAQVELTPEIAQKALESFLDGTHKFHNPPKQSDPDVILRRVISEWEQLRSQQKAFVDSGVPVPQMENHMFIHAHQNAVCVYVFKDGFNYLMDKVTLRGMAPLQVGEIKKLIKKYKPDKVVLDKAGFGESIRYAIEEYYEKLKQI